MYSTAAHVSFRCDRNFSRTPGKSAFNEDPHHRLHSRLLSIQRRQEMQIGISPTKKNRDRFFLGQQVGHPKFHPTNQGQPCHPNLKQWFMRQRRHMAIGEKNCGTVEESDEVAPSSGLLHFPTSHKTYVDLHSTNRSRPCRNQSTIACQQGQGPTFSVHWHAWERRKRKKRSTASTHPTS